MDFYVTTHKLILFFLEESLDETEMNFHQNRANYPCLFIVTPYDECKSWYTKTAPTKEVLRRISILAKECFEAFCNSITREVFLDIKVMCAMVTKTDILIIIFFI